MVVRCSLVLAIIFLGCSSQKEEKLPTQSTRVSQMPTGNAVAGSVLFATCKTCHGETGGGNKSMNAPALVNSNDWYLYRQLMNFKKGVRGYLPEDTLGIQMAAFAKTLNDSIAVSDVVAHIKTLPEVSLPVIVKGDVGKGQRLYQSICGSCHGPEGKGNEKMNAPRLNGLDDWYIKRQIANYKKSIRGGHVADKLGAQMVSMVASLSEEQVKDVIAYIRSTTQSTAR